MLIKRYGTKSKVGHEKISNDLFADDARRSIQFKPNEM